MTFGGLAVAPRAEGTLPPVGARRLALLAAVAASGETGITRDRLVGLFWPDADEEHGRHSLRQALYALRDEAGPVLRQAGPSLFLDHSHATSDIEEFRAALSRGDLSAAAQLYRGPFLEGFFLSGATEFERWVEAERARLGGAAALALRTLATRATEAGQMEVAVAWWQRLALLEPLSGRTAAALARALLGAGDRAGALAVLRNHEALVRRELEAPPDPEVTALSSELQRASGAAPSAPTAPPEEASGTRQATPLGGEPARAPRGRRAYLGWVLGAVALVIAVAWAAGLRGREAVETGTESAVALRFYQEGLESFQASQLHIARPLMEAALREDSSFAMAAYYLALMGEGDAWELRQRALRLAPGAPLRQRIQIQADILRRDHDPGAVVRAREWSERFPEDGQAFVVLGATLHTAGDWAGSVAALERGLALLDTEGGAAGACSLCEAFGRLAEVYFWWDSLPAVERTARRTLVRYPDRAGPLGDLALAAARSGDSARAFQYLRQLTAATESAVSDLYSLRVLLTLEEYDRVEESARRLLASARAADVGLARWMLTIGLRNQGRLEDARSLLRSGRLPGSPPPVVTLGPDYSLEAILALEAGDPRRAASLFEIQRTLGIPRAEGTRARWHTWHLTLVATALAAAGDTAAVRGLVDSVAYWGARSLYGRDQRAPHILRGFLLAGAGRDAEAAGEFRLAINSPTLGYTRVNLELARALLRLGRPGEAVPVLQAALRGDVDASNLYVTRTELHEVLAEAFRRQGEADSAAAHFRAVARALARADRPFRARREAAEARLRDEARGRDPG